MGLRAKFNLVLLLAFVGGLGLAAALTWRMEQANARQQALQEAAMMMAQASAISSYTDREIAPLLAEQMKVHFLPQSIPFFAAQSNFRDVSAAFPHYSFREPATNPTNPSDRPTDWQADIIDSFRREPKLAELVTERATPTGPMLAFARPIRIEDKGCLRCHSTPAEAPAPMVDLYGSAGGFGWKLGDTVGAQIVSVPLQVTIDRAMHTFTVLMIGLVAVFAVILLLLNLLLHYVIIRPVRRIAALASEVSLGNMEAPEFVPRGGDEIASLGQSFNRMRRSLATALKLVEG